VERIKQTIGVILGFLGSIMIGFIIVVTASDPLALYLLLFITFGVIIFIVALARPAIVPYVMAISFAFPFYTFISGYVVTLIQVITAIGILSLVIRRICSTIKFVELLPLDASMFVFFLYTSASALVASNHLYYLRAFARVIGFVATYLVVSRYITNYLVYRRFIRLLVLAAALAALVYIVGFLWFVVVRHVNPLTNPEERTSISATPFLNPNAFGGFLATVLPLSLLMFYNPDRKRQRFLEGLVVLSIVFGVTITGSRGALLASTVGFAIFYIMGSKGARLSLLFAIVVFGVVPFLFMFPDFLLNRFRTAVTLEDYNSVTRYIYFVVALRVFLDHPFTGVGLGNFLAVEPMQWLSMSDLSKFETLSGVHSIEHAHNALLTIAAELGIGGLAIYTLLVGQAINIARRNNYLRGFEGKVTKSIIASLAAFWTFGLFEYPLTMALGPIFFALLALISVFPRINRYRIDNGKIAN